MLNIQDSTTFELNENFIINNIQREGGQEYLEKYFDYITNSHDVNFYKRNLITCQKVVNILLENNLMSKIKNPSLKLKAEIFLSLVEYNTTH